jgi:hypothetical protein
MKHKKAEARTVATVPSPDKELEVSRSTGNESEDKRQEARAALEELTDHLVTMAGWREALQADINDSYELDREQFDTLVKRVHLFSGVAGMLCDMLGRHQ